MCWLIITLNECFQSTEAFNITMFNKLRGTRSTVSLLSVCCKFTHSVTHIDAVKTHISAWIVSSLHYCLAQRPEQKWDPSYPQRCFPLPHCAHQPVSMTDELDRDVLFNPSDRDEYRTLHVPSLNCTLNCSCLFFCRDLSMNSLAVIPTTGLSALSQLKLSGNPQMKNVLTAKNLPKLR